MSAVATMWNSPASGVLQILGSVGNLNKIEMTEDVRDALFDKFQPDGSEKPLVIMTKVAILDCLWKYVRSFARDLSKPSLVDSVDDVTQFAIMISNYTAAIRSITEADFDSFVIPSTQNF